MKVTQLPYVLFILYSYVFSPYGINMDVINLNSVFSLKVLTPHTSLLRLVTHIQVKSSLIHSHIIALVSVINANHFQYGGLFQPLPLLFHSLMGERLQCRRAKSLKYPNKGEENKAKEEERVYSIYCGSCYRTKLAVRRFNLKPFYRGEVIISLFLEPGPGAFITVTRNAL